MYLKIPEIVTQLGYKTNSLCSEHKSYSSHENFRLRLVAVVVTFRMSDVRMGHLSEEGLMSNLV